MHVTVFQTVSTRGAQHMSATTAATTFYALLFTENVETTTTKGTKKKVSNHRYTRTFTVNRRTP